MNTSPTFLFRRFSLVTLFVALGLVVSAARAAVVSYTISGKTTTNIVTSQSILDEFPVGTPWTVVVAWDTSAAALNVFDAQSQYRLTELTLTLKGKTADWTTSSAANKASFSLNNAGTDELQFTSGWGPTDHTNGTFLDMQPYSINVVLGDNTGAAIAALTPAPGSLTLSQWSADAARTYFKFYLNNDGNRFILGNIESIAVTAAPSPQTLTATVGAGATVQWQRNGATISGATNASYTISDVTHTTAGIYTAAVTNGGTTTLQSFIAAPSTTEKVVGTADEFANITHQNGNVYDQLLLASAAASFTADATQITRLSFVDMSDDIVQVEFSGAGTVSIVLEGATAPAPASNYNQDTVDYLKGHATIVITGANETSNLTIFSVGSITAVNQSLFKSGVDYDGYADVAAVAIQSSNGKFGMMRSGNTSFWNTKGLTGLYAPGVTFENEIFIHDINARETATPVFVIAGAKETRITGGDLEQDNDRAIVVAGLAELQLTAGTDSHGNLIDAQTNQGRLERDGADVTAEIIPGSNSGTTVELTYFAAGSNPPFTNGAKKTFEVSLTRLKFDTTTLTNATPLTLNAPLTGASFTDAATGLVWEVYFRNGAFHEINVMRNGQFAGQWSE